MNLIWSTSDKYSEIATTSIASVLQNSQDADEVNVYVIDMGLTQMHKSWIEELVTFYGRTLIWLEKLNIEKLIGTHIDVGRWRISTFGSPFFPPYLICTISNHSH